MYGVIVGLLILFLVAILLVIFRVNSLVDVLRGVDKKRVTTSNKINAYLFLVFAILGFGSMAWYSIVHFDSYSLPIASEHGILTDTLFWVTMGVTGIVFVLTHILLFYFSYRYRFSGDKEATFYPDNPKLELAWTLVPAVVLSILIFSGWQVWSQITDVAPEDAEVIEIMGYQFAWNVRYPGTDGNLGEYDYRLIDAVNAFGMDFRDEAAFDDFTPRQMHVPKGKPVLLKIRARDVLHSVYAPHFRLKMDAVPGMPTRFWFVPTKTTEEMREELANPDFNYEIACAEVCGRGHFSMRLMVVVDEPEAYEEWYASQKAWLSKNPEYMSKVPEELQELALTKTGLDKKEQVSTELEF